MENCWQNILSMVLQFCLVSVIQNNNILVTAGIAGRWDWNIFASNNFSVIMNVNVGSFELIFWFPDPSVVCNKWNIPLKCSPRSPSSSNCHSWPWTTPDKLDNIWRSVIITVIIGSYQRIVELDLALYKSQRWANRLLGGDFCSIFGAEDRRRDSDIFTIKDNCFSNWIKVLERWHVL